MINEIDTGSYIDILQFQNGNKTSKTAQTSKKSPVVSGGEDSLQEGAFLEDDSSYNPFTSFLSSFGDAFSFLMSSAQKSSNSNTSGTSSKKASSLPDLKSKSLDELTSMQTDKQKAIDSANDDIKAVQTGENENVKNAVKDADEKEKVYKEALESDKKVSDKLKEKQKTNQNKIKSSEDKISDIENSIVDDKAKISKLDTQITSKEGEISSLEASLGSLPKKTKDNKDDWSAIDAKEAETRRYIDYFKQQLKALKADKKEAESAKGRHETSLKNEKDNLKTLKDERDKIEKEILESCSDETKEALEAWTNAREAIDEVKQTELQKAESALSSLQGELDEINQAINEAYNKEIENGNEPYKTAESFVDFALAYKGNGASEMSEIMRGAGATFNDGNWCADFVSFMLEQSYGENIPGDALDEITNRSTCCGYASWAENEDILMDERRGEYDKSQVKAGDLILYNDYETGEWYHIGIVASVDKDGTIHTIEGNTNGGEGCVDGHDILPEDTNYSFILMNKIKENKKDKD